MQAGRNAQRRGTVLLLVVSSLVMLLVMSTVYVVASRTDRKNTRATNNAMDLDLAYDAVVNYLRQLVYDAAVDGSGNVLGKAPATGKKARYIDFPEVGSTLGQSGFDANTPDQSWLVGMEDDIAANWTRLVNYTSANSPTFNRFDPSTNDFTYLPGSLEAAAMDPAAGNDSYWQLLTFTSAQNIRYRWATRIVETSGGANLNTMGVDSSQVDVDGRYLSGVQGWNFALAGGDPAVNLHNGSGNTYGRGGGSILVSGAAVAGWSFNLADWHDIVRTLEFPQSLASLTYSSAPAFDNTRIWYLGDMCTYNGVTYCALADVLVGGSGPPSANWAAVPDAAWKRLQWYRYPRQAEPFDWADELELRAKNSYRSQYKARPVQLWPQTMGGAYRNRLTAYSWDRLVAPPGAAAWLAGGIDPWPANQARINVNSYLPPAPLWNCTNASSSVARAWTPSTPNDPTSGTWSTPVTVNWQTYLKGDVVTGLDGRQYICQMSHVGYSRRVIGKTYFSDNFVPYSGSGPLPTAPPNEGLRPSATTPTAPGRDPAASAYWNYIPDWTTVTNLYATQYPFAKGYAWYQGQRCTYSSKVYFCKLSIPERIWNATKTPPGYDYPRGDPPAGGSPYWLDITSSTPTTYPFLKTPFNYTRTGILANTATNIASAMKQASAQAFPTNASYPGDAARWYTDDECRAFAVNYLTARYGNGGFVNNLYSLPCGPSFLDGTGVCVRGGTWNGSTFVPDNADFGSGNAAEFTSGATNRLIVGHAAQPYLNEVCMKYNDVGVPTGSTSYPPQDVGIELINPNSVALDFRTLGATGEAQWKLYVYPAGVDPTTATPTIIKLGDLIPAGIPAGQCVVITDLSDPNTQKSIFWKASSLIGAGAAAQVKSFPGLMAAMQIAVTATNSGAAPTPYGTILLTRPGMPRGAVDFSQGVVDLVVDRFYFYKLPKVNETGANRYWSIGRPNYDKDGTVNLWMASWACQQRAATNSGWSLQGSPTIGVTNLASVSTGGILSPALVDTPLTKPSLFAPTPMAFVRPIDRWAEGYTSDTNFNFTNLAQFNQVMRVAHTAYVSGYPGTYGTPPWTLPSPNLAAPTSGTPSWPAAPPATPAGATYTYTLGEWLTARLNYYDAVNTNGPLPAQLNSTANGNIGGTVARGDFAWDAAVRFDFKSTAAYATGGGTSYGGLADPRAAWLLEYLSTTERASDIMDVGGDVDPYKSLVDPNRVRMPGRVNVNTANTNTLANLTSNLNATMLSNLTTYRGGNAVGKGIRNMGELYTAMTGAINSAVYTTAPYNLTNGAKSLYERDLPFARTWSYLTVRSDAFVGYVVLEAVKPNPNFGSFDNSSNWYGAVTDDSQNTSSPLQLVGRRRFMVLLDRSLAHQPRSSSEFRLPRVVGTRDLPPLP